MDVLLVPLPLEAQKRLWGHQGIRPRPLLVDAGVEVLARVPLFPDWLVAKRESLRLIIYIGHFLSTHFIKKVRVNM